MHPSILESFNETFTQQTPANDNDSENPSEIQKAVCTVTAGEVRASAEAVTTKALKGVCGTNDMNKAFGSLENRLLKELENIENRLTNELEIIKNMLVVQSQQGVGGCNRSNITDNISTKSIVLLQPIPTARNVNDENSYSSTPKIKTKSYTMLTSIRGKDIVKPNREKDEKIFTYFWKIENFTKKIENNADNFIQNSPTFTIKGARFYKICLNLLQICF